MDLTIEIGGLVLGQYQGQTESGVTHASIGRFVSLARSAPIRPLSHALPKKVASHEPSVADLAFCQSANLSNS